MPKRHGTNPHSVRDNKEGQQRFERCQPIKKRQSKRRFIFPPEIPKKMEELGFRKKTFFNQIQNCGIMINGMRITGVERFLESVERKKENGEITNIELLFLKYSLDGTVWRFYNIYGQNVHAIDNTTYKTIQKVLKDYGFFSKEIEHFKKLFSDYFWERMHGTSIDYSK